MPIEDSPAVQALLDHQADTLIDDIYGHIEDLSPRDFIRWLSRRMYHDGRAVARLSRTEQEGRQVARHAVPNGNVNTCTCVHCAPFLDRPHGNGCSGYHCKGTCL